MFKTLQEMLLKKNKIHFGLISAFLSCIDPSGDHPIDYFTKTTHLQVFYCSLRRKAKRG